MNMLTVEQVAKNWNLSPRTIQNLCKNGKIEGAASFGRSWMIPEDAKRPLDGRCKAVKEAKKSNKADKPEPLIRKSPFLDMTDLYNRSGAADECIKALDSHHEAKALFAAEIAYSRGEIDKVYESANYFLENHTGLYSVIASGMLLGLCAMWRGDIKLWYQAKKHLLKAPHKNSQDRDIVTLALASTDSAIRNTRVLILW